MANNLQITNIDFDQIKSNLKQYLQGQAEFTDYDFEGSGLSILLDILAYNTHYNAFYINMALNELFIDTAVKRESVVSLAKLLNYTPRSVRSAQATIDLTVNGVSETGSLTLERYTPFTSTINQQTFTFYNLDSVTISSNGTEYTQTGIDVYEGVYVVNKFNVVSPGPSEKYVIPNKNVDTTTIRVTVQDSPEVTNSTTYTMFDGDITAVTGTTNIYYIDQNAQGYYEIYFGDGLLGTKLTAGNRVTIEYLVSNGTAANVSDKVNQTISLSGTLIGPTYTSVDVTVTSKSNTGQDEETIDEIRFNAPRAAAAQNRLVTKYDYEAFVKKNYNYIDAVTVWGGEDNDPPQYGKIFISAIPKQSQYLTTARKNAIISDIAVKRVASITPVFVEADDFYASVSSVVKFNPNITNKVATDIQGLVNTSIQNYFSLNSGSFGDYFSYSKLIAAIDDADESILGNLTSVTLEKRITPTTGVAFSKYIKLNNKFDQHKVASTQFYYTLNNEIYAARIKDIPDEATISVTGTYRRSGSIITVTLPSAHDLIVGENVTLTFTGAAIDGEYAVDTTESTTKFTVISEETGNDSGTVSVQSASRGRLRVYDVASAAILNNNIGFVSYNEGIIQINNLNVYGFLPDQTDLRLYFNLTDDSQDISVVRNQIIRLSTDTVNSSTNRIAGLNVSTIAIPK